MGSIRKRKVPVKRLTPELMDGLIKEMGAEFRGEVPKEEEEITFTRKQLMVYDCIRKNPGIRRAALERIFGSGVKNILLKLMRVGLISKEKQDPTVVRYYPVGDGHGSGRKN